MPRRAFRRSVLFIAVMVCGALIDGGLIAQKSDPPKPGASRKAWTRSAVKGTPDPPQPFRVTRVFPKLGFTKPVHLTSAPGSDRFFLCEQGGKIFSFPIKEGVDRADPVIDVSTELISWKSGGEIGGFDSLYGLTFHPDFAKNRTCFVCYVIRGKRGELPDGSRVSRFKMTGDHPPRIDPKSEEVLLTFLGGGHNGGCLAFGPDRCL